MVDLVEFVNFEPKMNTKCKKEKKKKIEIRNETRVLWSV